MKTIIIKHLNFTLDDLYNPYPGFSDPNTLSETVQALQEKHKESIQAAEQQFSSLEEAVYEDIHDDIANCGRNPFSKFIEQIEFLAIVRETNKAEFDTILDYIASSMASEIQDNL